MTSTQERAVSGPDRHTLSSTQPQQRPNSPSPTPAHAILALPPHEASRSRGSVSSQLSQRFTLKSWKSREYHHWKSPALMIGFLLIGFGISLGHCIFYPSLNGQVVGDSAKQEEKLRIGTAFAFLAQLALTSSVWKSYTQWLWRAVYRNDRWTPHGLDRAFGVDTAPSSLLSRNFLQNFRLGAVMAFFAWCLILPPFFTPAALFVYPSTEQVSSDEQVPFLAIANGTAGGEFAYSPPMNSSTTKFKDDSSRLFTGPRTILPLLSSTTASRGEILPIIPPSNHSSYTLDFYGPIVKCREANTMTSSLIAGLLREYMTMPLQGTARQNDSAYFGFVPAINSTGDLVALSQPRYRVYPNGTNELWMTFQRYALDEGGSRTRTRAYQVCGLHNATYNLQLDWDHGVQNVTGSYIVGDEVSYPNNKLGDVSNMASHAYAAFMWTLIDQLVGSFAWYKEPDMSDGSDSERAAQFGAIESPIRHTSILGSVDLDIFFDFNIIHGLYVSDNETDLSPQRLQDKSLARNRTLAVLIEELSFNTTVSLLHNKLLTYNTTRVVSRWNDVNRYGYIATSLYIPYALGNLIAIAAAILGMVSFMRHGTYPDKTFRDIANAASTTHILQMVRGSGETERPP